MYNTAGLHQRCLALINTGEYQQVVSLLTDTDTRPYLDATLLAFRGMAYEMEGFKKNAMEDCRTAVRMEPENDLCWTMLGTVLSDQDNPTDAIPAFDKALALNPTNINALLNRASTYYRMEQYDLVLKDCSHVLALDEKNVKALYWRATIFIEKDEYSKAIKDLEAYVRLVPEDASGHYYLGEAHNKNGTFLKAVECFDKAIQLVPDLAEAFYQRATAYNGLGNDDMASFDISRAIALDAQDKYYRARGVVFLNQRKYKKALQDFFKGSEMDPDDSEFQMLIAEAYRYLGEYRSSLSHIDNYIESIRDNAAAYCIKGLCHFNLGDHVTALKDLDRAIQLSQEAYLYANRGLIYMNGFNEQTEALKDFNMAISMDPSNIMFYYNRGVCYSMLKNADAAIQDYLHAIRLDKISAFPWLGLSRLDQSVLTKHLDCSKSSCFHRACHLLLYWPAAFSFKMLLSYLVKHEAPMGILSVLQKINIFPDEIQSDGFLSGIFRVTRPFRKQFLLWEGRRDYPAVSVMAEAMMQYYMGNPLATYAMLKEASRDPAYPFPCTLHYYLASAADAFLEPHDDILHHHALPLARKTLQQTGTSEREQYYAALILDLAGDTAEALAVLEKLYHAEYDHAFYKWADITGRSSTDNFSIPKSFIDQIKLKSGARLIYYEDIEPVIISSDESKVLDEIQPLIHTMESKNIIGIIMQEQQFERKASSCFDEEYFFAGKVRFLQFEQVEASGSIKERHPEKYQRVFGSPEEKRELEENILNCMNRKENACKHLGAEIHEKAFTVYMYKKNQYKDPPSVDFRKYLVLISNLYERQLLTAEQGHRLHQYVYYSLEKIAEYTPDESVTVAINEAKGLIDAAQLFGIGFGTFENLTNLIYNKLMGKESPVVSFDAFLKKVGAEKIGEND